MTLFDFINESPWWSLAFIFAIAYCVESPIKAFKRK